MLVSLDNNSPVATVSANDPTAASATATATADGCKPDLTPAPAAEESIAPAAATTPPPPATAMGLPKGSVESVLAKNRSDVRAFIKKMLDDDDEGTLTPRMMRKKFCDAIGAQEEDFTDATKAQFKSLLDAVVNGDESEDEKPVAKAAAAKAKPAAKASSKEKAAPAKKKAAPAKKKASKKKRRDDDDDDDEEDSPSPSESEASEPEEDSDSEGDRKRKKVAKAAKHDKPKKSSKVTEDDLEAIDPTAILPRRTRGVRVNYREKQASDDDDDDDGPKDKSESEQDSEDSDFNATRGGASGSDDD